MLLFFLICVFGAIFFYIAVSKLRNMECLDTVLLKYLEKETGYIESRSETPVGIRFQLEPGFSKGRLWS